MSDTQVIREFLVSLGFKVDEGGVRKFTGTLGKTTNVALTAGKAVIGIGLATQAMVASFTSGMEKLYYASRRTKSSVENLQALEYGSKQIGLAAGEAQGALEAMTAAVRMNPGLRGLLDGMLGKKTAGMDQMEVMLSLVQKLGNMPHMVGARFAQMFGMDERTFLMVKDGMPELLAAMEKRKNMNSSLGIDAQKAAEAAKEYQNSIREIVEKIGVIGQKWSIEVLPHFREFNKLINNGLDRLANFKLEGGIKTFVDFMSKITGGASGAIDAAQKGDAVGALESVVKNSPGVQLLKKGFDAVNAWRDSYRTTPLPADPRTLTDTGVGPLVPSSPRGGKLPLGLRQNNPGNLRAWGDAPVQNGFARFNSAAEGLSAMAGNLVGYYQKHGLKTVRDIVSRWAPSNENDTKSYIDVVAKRIGVEPGQSLNLKDPATLSRLMGAMIQHENGYNPYGTTELMTAAQGRLGGAGGQGKQVTIHQKTDIHIAGVADPGAAGAAVSAGQGRVNSDLVRNMAGVVQ